MSKKNLSPEDKLMTAIYGKPLKALKAHENKMVKRLSKKWDELLEKHKPQALC